MAVFTVIDRDRPGVTLFSSDDWLEAEAFAASAPHRHIYDVKGTHPSHEWDGRTPRRCRACGGWDNGSYGSHAPCGYDFEHKSLHWHIERYLEAQP